ncbi:MAG TPA: NlpC/P60 family protein [Chloroflexota bacterium]|nr:NlpC/P60 family protein [Chloroflexota bacterium]
MASLALAALYAIVRDVGAVAPVDTIMVAGARTEAPAPDGGVDPLAVGDGGHSIGIFQLHDQGRGAGLSVAQRQDFTVATRTMLPYYRRGYELAQSEGLAGEEAAVYAYLHAERPAGYPDRHSAAAARFRAEYRALTEEALPMDPLRARVADVAAWPSWQRFTYRLDPPPDGVMTLDCSLYVLQVFDTAGAEFPAGVRTAEQIRAACDPVDWDSVQPGDLLFFEHTYATSERSAVGDGHVATHVGISLGAGTQRMWDCHERAGSAVGETDISTAYWQEKLFEARRPRQLGVSELCHKPETPDGADLAAELAQEREWGGALQTEIGGWADELERCWAANDLDGFHAVLATMRRNAS